MSVPETGGWDAGAGTRVSNRGRLRAPDTERSGIDRESNDLPGSTRAGDAPGGNHSIDRLSARGGGDGLRRPEQRRRQAQRRPAVRRVRPDQRDPGTRDDRDGSASKRRQSTRGPPHHPRGYREVRVRRPLSRLRPRPRRRRLPRRGGARGPRGRRTPADRPRRRRRAARGAGGNASRPDVPGRRRALRRPPARSAAHVRDDRPPRALRRLLPRDEFRQVPRPPRARAPGTPRPRALR